MPKTTQPVPKRVAGCVLFPQPANPLRRTMNEHVRIELIPRLSPIDDATRAQRERAVESLANLGHLDPAEGEIADTVQDGWLARINGTLVPVSDFGIGPIEGRGQALVSLLIPADSVSIGVQPSAQQPATPEPRSTWGAPGKPDPREGIAGWKPPTSESLTVHLAPSAAAEVAATGIRMQNWYPQVTA